MQPLKGIRVLDLTRAMAGPFCTMMLGDLGADVIKVERPEWGDESRGWGPPFVGTPYGAYPGESAYFISANRNKRGITTNLKSPEGQGIIRRLAAQSDILVENFRTGVLDSMGLGYEDLAALNPRLVYCSISGYGRTGPFADRPGYDFVIQAEGGFMGITGPEEGPPYRVGVPIIDITAGMFAATATLAALHARHTTGEGQLIDLSLLETQVALLANVASNHLVGGEVPPRLGNAIPTSHPTRRFQPVIAGSLWPLVMNASGPSCARCSTSPSSRRTRGSPTTRPGSSTGRLCVKFSMQHSRPATPMSGWNCAARLACPADRLTPSPRSLLIPKLTAES